MGKIKKKKAKDWVDKNKSLDVEAGASRAAVIEPKSVAFHCFRCDCTKHAKRQFVWKTSQGDKLVCNGCHGLLTSLARSG